MKARHFLTLWAVLLIWGTRATALAPIGPPKSLLSEGEYGLGLDISYQSIDLTATGVYRETQAGPFIYSKRPELSIRDLGSQLVFATLTTAINDQVDIFVNVGVSNATDDILVQNAPANSTQFFNAGNIFKLDAGHDFAWGAGARFTFLEQEGLTWGGTIHATWQNPQSSTENWTDPSDATQRLNLNTELDYWEVVFAFGPTVEMGEVSFYGGPMAYILKGDLTMDGTWNDTGTTGPFKAEYDFEENLAVGGFFGAQTNVADNLSWYIDGQITADTWGIGIGGVWRVE